MQFVSLKDLERLDNLPVIIAGPIIRRVEKNTVTVWLALSLQVELITINVIDSRDGSIVLSGNNGNIGPKRSFKLGERLYVTTFSAIPTGVTELDPGIKYYYELVFDIENSSKTLSSPGILNYPFVKVGNSYVPEITGGINRICYPGELLPSFIFPPTDLSFLKVIHGSCRKPHGESIDSFVALDQMIGDYINDSNLRPHLLFLTGDQIYADDVADQLLYLIDDASKALMGWVEVLPESGVAAELQTEDLPLKLSPGNRTELVGSAYLTAGLAGKSHLMRLGEFYCMYLFVWSDILWPQPNFGHELPDKSMIYHSGVTDLEGTFNDEAKYLNLFISTLPRVRRQLANIPIYMMCDDHEITDDWNLNLNWIKDIFGDSISQKPRNELGIRIIQNGLTAFHLFQSWGNQPANYSSGPFINFMNEMDNLYSQDANIRLDTWQNAEQYILPNLIVTNNGMKESLVGGLDFHFHVKYINFQVIGLNTRTRRSFDSGSQQISEYANLISDQSLMNQLDIYNIFNIDTGYPLTLIISPAPVIGHPFIEDLIQPGVAYFDDIIAAIDSGQSGSIKRDAEAWALNREGIEKLLSSIAQFGRAVIFSGDIHYAYSAQIKYWDQRNIPHLSDRTNEKRALIVQLVSSSLKNRTDLTSKIASAASYLDSRAGVAVNEREFFGWKNSSQGTYQFQPYVATPDLNLTSYIRLPYSYFEFRSKEMIVAVGNVIGSTSSDPHWRYKVSFVVDDSFEVDRQTFFANGQNLDLTDGNPMNLASIHLAVSRWFRPNRIVIGENNVSRIHFNFTGAANSLTQSFYFSRKDSVDNLDDYTHHTILIDVPSDDINEMPNP